MRSSGGADDAGHEDTRADTVDGPYLRSALDREAASIVLCLTLAALVFLPRSLSSLTGLLLVLVTPVLVVILRPRALRPIDRPTGFVLGAFGLAAAVPGLRSLATTDPRVALFGPALSHNGALLWLGLAVTVTVLVSRWRPGDAERMARAGALFGAVLGLSAVLDWLGLYAAWKNTSEPAGLLENSISLAQVIVIGLGCAVAWARRGCGGRRVAAVAAALLCVIGLAIGSVRAAWVGAAVAAFIVIVYVLVSPPTGRKRVVGASALVAAMLAVLGASWFVMGRSVDPVVPGWLVDAANGRTAIWTSAFARIRQSPWTGQGPGRFSAWISWSAQPGGPVGFAGTTSPHNVLLEWVLSSGLLGLSVFCLAVFAALWALFRVLDSKGSGVPAAAMVAGLIAWGVTLMFGWATPVGGLLAAMVVAALVPMGSTPTDHERPPKSVTYGAAGLAVGLLVLGLGLCAASWPVLKADYISGSMIDAGRSDPEVFAAAALATGDPSSATAAVDGLLAARATANDADGRRLLAIADSLKPALARAATWDVYAALAWSNVIATDQHSASGFDWAGYRGAMSAGNVADPASGMWDYQAATAADQLGKHTEAAAYAQRALSYPQSPTIRRWLSGVAATQR